VCTFRVAPAPTAWPRPQVEAAPDPVKAAGPCVTAARGAPSPPPARPSVRPPARPSARPPVDFCGGGRGGRRPGRAPWPPSAVVRAERRAPRHPVLPCVFALFIVHALCCSPCFVGYADVRFPLDASVCGGARTRHLVAVGCVSTPTSPPRPPRDTVTAACPHSASSPPLPPLGVTQPTRERPAAGFFPPAPPPPQPRLARNINGPGRVLLLGRVGYDRRV